MKYSLAVALLVILPGARCLAQADNGWITVTSSQGSCPTCQGQFGNIVINGAPGLWTVSIPATVHNLNSSIPEAYFVTVKAILPGQSIEWVRVDANRGTDTKDYVVVTVTPDDQNDTIPTLWEISKSSGNADLSISAIRVGQLGTSSIPGFFRAQRIANMQIPKDTGVSGYTGDIFASFEAISGGSILQPEVLEINCGNNFLGNIATSTLGPGASLIGKIIAGGDIGSSSNPATLKAINEIQSVTAKSIWANLETTAASLGAIRRVETTGAAAGAGSFTGSITTGIMDSVTGTTAGLLVKGALNADAVFKNYLAATNVTIGSLPAGRRIKIGQGWGAGRTMTFGSLAGQVDLNSLNGSAPWSGTIKVGPPGSQVTLSPAPHYDNLSGTLGGGAVGLVPYSLHDLESFPENGESLAVLNSTTTVLFSHYGPVFWATGSAPFVIDWAEAGTGNWETLRLAISRTPVTRTITATSTSRPRRSSTSRSAGTTAYAPPSR
ncbi:MAG: hypothetical protein IT437_13110 [Phycisphaerales bacterium]|nr:hypothetical protein [Phycisphaerales bacterium]